MLQLNLPPFQKHCVIDFTGLSSRDVDNAAKLLKREANTRGWLYR